jgi:hypothetical protein
LFQIQVKTETCGDISEADIKYWSTLSKQQYDEEETEERYIQNEM